jgi:hypothetical protein
MQSAPSTWSATESVALAWQCAESIEETRETHGDIRRRSLTETQHLELRGQVFEFEPRKSRSIVKKWNGHKAQYEPVFDAPPVKGMPWVPRPIWVKGMPDAEGWIENSRLTWKSDKTLLRRGLPDTAPRDIKRLDPRTKLVSRDPREEPITVEIPILGTDEIDALNLDDNDLG